MLMFPWREHNADLTTFPLKRPGISAARLTMHEYGVAVELPAAELHVATVIVCHGMDDSGQRWNDLAMRWSWHLVFPHIKFVFPQAPQRPITFLEDSLLPAWFDVLTTNDIRGGKYDTAGLIDARNYLEDLIHAEVTNGIPSKNIFIGGFSQGGALALYTGVTTKHAIGGVFALSGYMPMLPDVKNLLNSSSPQSNNESPRPVFFLSHGTNDVRVKYPWAEWTVEALKGAGYQVEFKTYPRCGHQPRSYTREDLTTWLKDRAPYDISYDIIA